MRDVDTEQARLSRPEAFERWRVGRVRPYWFSAVRARHGRSEAEAEERFESGQVEAGFLYPPWTFLCRFADWIGCDVSEFTAPTLRVKAPVVRSATAEAEIAGLFRVRYHPAIVANTMRNLNSRYGIESLEAVEAARPRAMATAGHGNGTQRTAGVSVAEVLEDLDAQRDPETRILRARWARILSPVWALVAGNAIPTAARAEVRAWMDSSQSLTVMATQDRSRTVILSVAAHHKDHGRVPLPEGELDYWIPVLFNPKQILGVTRHGALTGYQNDDDPIGVLTTEYLTYTPVP